MNRILIKFLILTLTITSCTMKTNDQRASRNEGGIVFIRTASISSLKDFYLERVGCDLWLDQGGCAIFKHGNLLLGFCEAEEAELEGVYTFFYTRRERVNDMYEIFKEIADGPPRDNPRYGIYHFYARDPEGRTIEFQYFNHAIGPF